MTTAHQQIAFERMRRSLLRHMRAYLARPELLTTEHADQLAYLARSTAHAAREAGLLAGNGYDYASSETAYGRTVAYPFAIKVF